MKKIITLVFVMTILISCNKPSLEKAETLIKAEKYEEALKIIRPMAEKANLRAQFSLGLIYYKGKGLAKDYVKAHKWVSLSAAQNSEYDKARNIIEEDMTKEQIVEAQKLASEFVPK
ncbi:MAG: hypothetical protein KKD35_07980 [Elusimicrobia bacterium]|nr:hypothetical protein [Elusimicrobiota bacterium]